MTQDELMVEARLAIPTTFVVIYDSLMSLLKEHEKHVIINKETLIHVTQMDNGSYRARYELSSLEITRRVKEVYKEFLLNPPSTQP